MRTEWLRAETRAASVEPGGKDFCIVEDKQIAPAQKLREVVEQAVGVVSSGALQVQHAGIVAGSQGLLGDELFGKMEVEVGDEHMPIIGLRLSNRRKRPEFGLPPGTIVRCRTQE